MTCKNMINSTALVSALVTMKHNGNVQANTCARDTGLPYSTVTLVLACHNALMIYECNSTSSNTLHRTASFPELCWINCGFWLLIPVRLQLKHVTQRAAAALNRSAVAFAKATRAFCGNSAARSLSFHVLHSPTVLPSMKSKLWMSQTAKKIRDYLVYVWLHATQSFLRN